MKFISRKIATVLVSLAVLTGATLATNTGQAETTHLAAAKPQKADPTGTQASNPSTQRVHGNW